MCANAVGPYKDRRTEKGQSRFGTRRIRCFLPIAEEPHFARAAERLHIEQSPLSRTTKELEDVGTSSCSSAPAARQRKGYGQRLAQPAAHRVVRRYRAVSPAILASAVSAGDN
ncbi:hypothetical protein BV918_12985 [Pectobacterium odoriferum]|nr:hypothetical protein BV918_12985 [Pectobacterium odoriferum]POE35059.1 hypothetical protein BV922_11610 [Pectobacterium odoriferum]